jgi:hypothetical protein
MARECKVEKIYEVVRKAFELGANSRLEFPLVAIEKIDKSLKLSVDVVNDGEDNATVVGVDFLGDTIFVAIDIEYFDANFKDSIREIVEVAKKTIKETE